MTSLDDVCRATTASRCRAAGRAGRAFCACTPRIAAPTASSTSGVTFVSEEKEAAALEFCAARRLRLNFIGAGYRDHDEYPRTRRGHRAALSRPARARLDPAARLLPVGTTGAPLCRTRLSRDDEHVVLVGQRRPVHRAHRRHVLPDLIPLRRMLDAGLVVGCGSDWGPKNIFEHIELARSHRFAGSGRRISARHSRVAPRGGAMWTSEAARALGWDGIGTLAARTSRRSDHRRPIRCAVRLRISPARVCCAPSSAAASSTTAATSGNGDSGPVEAGVSPARRAWRAVCSTARGRVCAIVAGSALRARAGETPAATSDAFS